MKPAWRTWERISSGPRAELAPAVMRNGAVGGARTRARLGLGAHTAVRGKAGAAPARMAELARTRGEAWLPSLLFLLLYVTVHANIPVSQVGRLNLSKFRVELPQIIKVYFFSK